MLTQGIDRIIEQIVNPKIFQVIKPKVDEAVCACLGLDVKLWQAENARHREEMQCLQQAIHHAQLDANIKDMQKKELEKQQQHMAEMQQQQQTYVSGVLESVRAMLRQWMSGFCILSPVLILMILSVVHIHNCKLPQPVGKIANSPSL